MITKDEQEIKVGTWLQDETGFYEVVEISDVVKVVGIYFTDKGYILTEEYIKTPAQIRKMYIA